MNDLVAVIRATDALLSLLANAGISMAKLQNLRDQNADGHLRDDQVQDLARQAHDSVARLG